MSDLLARLTDLEKQLLDPATRQNPDAASQLIADDFEEIGASGRHFTRADVLADMEIETATEPVFSGEYRLKEISETQAMLFYITSANADLQPHTKRMSLWEKGADDQWRVRYHQGTKAP